MATSKRTSSSSVGTPPLPKGILKADTLRPSQYTKSGKLRKGSKPYHEVVAQGKDGSTYGYHEYELWYTERFGWVIPTLLISRSKGSTPDRYYGITIGDEKPDYSRSAAERRDRERGQQVRIGKGPHVLHQVSVYIRKDRIEKLQFLIDLYNQGQISANDTRDRISTRRARTASRRSAFGDMFRF